MEPMLVIKEHKTPEANGHKLDTCILNNENLMARTTLNPKPVNPSTPKVPKPLNPKPAHP